MSTCSGKKGREVARRMRVNSREMPAAHNHKFRLRASSVLETIVLHLFLPRPPKKRSNMLQVIVHLSRFLFSENDCHMLRRLEISVTLWWTSLQLFGKFTKQQKSDTFRHRSPAHPWLGKGRYAQLRCEVLFLDGRLHRTVLREERKCRFQLQKRFISKRGSRSLILSFQRYSLYFSLFVCVVVRNFEPKFRGVRVSTVFPEIVRYIFPWSTIQAK